MGADAFFAALKAKMLGGSGFDRHLVHTDAEGVGNSLAHGRDVGGQLGLLGYHDTIDIFNLIAFLLE